TTISNSDSRILERGVIATSNNSIINDSSQHKLPKTRKIIKHSKSRSTVFAPFKPPVKKAKISNSKSNLQQNQFYNTQKNQLYKTQENRSYSIQENQSYNAQKNQSYYAQEDQLYNTHEDQSYNAQKNQSYELVNHLNTAQNYIRPRNALESITNNIILQIPLTDKPLTINLNLTFGK
ncbi:10543_t:CDS:2, partial [Dentiscutata heterogama]